MSRTFNRQPLAAQSGRRRDPGQDRASILDEVELLIRLRAGEEEAFAVLVDRHHAAMVRLAMSYVHSRAVAEEVAQDAWLGVLRGLDRFEGRSSLRTWLYRIVANIARTRAVKEARSAPFSSFGDEPSVDPERFIDGHWAKPPEPWRAVLDSEARALVDRAIAVFPDQQRQVIQ